MAIFSGSLIRECVRRMKIMQTQFEYSGSRNGASNPSEAKIPGEQVLSRMNKEVHTDDRQRSEAHVAAGSKAH